MLSGFVLPVTRLCPLVTSGLRSNNRIAFAMAKRDVRPVLCRQHSTMAVGGPSNGVLGGSIVFCHHSSNGFILRQIMGYRGGNGFAYLNSGR